MSRVAEEAERAATRLQDARDAGAVMATSTQDGFTGLFMPTQTAALVLAVLSRVGPCNSLLECDGARQIDKLTYELSRNPAVQRRAEEWTRRLGGRIDLPVNDGMPF